MLVPPSRYTWLSPSTYTEPYTCHQIEASYIMIILLFQYINISWQTYVHQPITDTAFDETQPVNTICTAVHSINLWWPFCMSKSAKGQLVGFTNAHTICVGTLDRLKTLQGTCCMQSQHKTAKAHITRAYKRYVSYNEYNCFAIQNIQYATNKLVYHINN